MSGPPPIPTGSILISPVGYKRMMDELRQLFDIERPKIVDEVQQAAAQGDRSENAEYIYGKKKLREIDRRMNFLKRRLDAMKLIDPARNAHHGTTIQFGAQVEIEDEDGQKRTYQILGEDEADPKSGAISWKSPIGAALIGKKLGDFITVAAPSGPRDYTVIAVIYPSTKS